jgi:hypothetical protein
LLYKGLLPPVQPQEQDVQPQVLSTLTELTSTFDSAMVPDPILGFDRRSESTVAVNSGLSRKTLFREQKRLVHSDGTGSTVEVDSEEADDAINTAASTPEKILGYLSEVRSNVSEDASKSSTALVAGHMFRSEAGCLVFWKLIDGRRMKEVRCRLETWKKHLRRGGSTS